jgi:hypothetical protein
MGSLEPESIVQNYIPVSSTFGRAVQTPHVFISRPDIGKKEFLLLSMAW